MRERNPSLPPTALIVAFVLIVWTTSGGISAWLAREKGRSAETWFGLGMLLGPIAVTALGFAPVAPRGRYKACAECHEAVLRMATTCPHCRSDLLREVVADGAAERSRATDDEVRDLVAELIRESPRTIRRLLLLLAVRADAFVPFSRICDELGVTPTAMRTEMARFAARWDDEWTQRGRGWFFDVWDRPDGEVSYRMNPDIARIVRSSLATVSRRLDARLPR